VGEIPVVRLQDTSDLGAERPGEEHVTDPLGDAAAVVEMAAGVDVIIHLAGAAPDAGWSDTVEDGIRSAIHVFEAARMAGVKRILVASSGHVTGFHRRERRVDHTADLRPDSPAAVARAFTENLARHHADKHGISAFCMRLGSVSGVPTDARSLSTWMSFQDFLRLVTVGLTASYHFEVVYGISANSRAWWDNSNARRLGYRPLDNAETFAAQLLLKRQPDPVGDAFHGGDACAQGFTGRLADIT
jgi:uronate dehydrogenase